jgi:hypothetical protein
MVFLVVVVFVWPVDMVRGMGRDQHQRRRWLRVTIRQPCLAEEDSFRALRMTCTRFRQAALPQWLRFPR